LCLYTVAWEIRLRFFLFFVIPASDLHRSPFAFDSLTPGCVFAFSSRFELRKSESKAKEKRCNENAGQARGRFQRLKKASLEIYCRCFSFRSLCKRLSSVIFFQADLK
ncbi:hypothetical protein, partial [Pararcticibacter amylolyticus]|uniref:hypothetical protein n=1 Tax=Pararcticibacter amylolyticus TaxID=2173175 RepID=UPI001EE4A467